MTKSITIIVGSTRTNRIGKAMADWVASCAAEEFDTVELLDLKEVNLPKFDAAVSPMAEPIDTPEALAWGETIASTERLLFVTPEYNRSVPSDLKAAIDMLYGEWNEKPAAILSYGYIEGGRNAGKHLRDSLAHLNTNLVEHTAAIQLSEALVQNGEVQPEEITSDTKADVTQMLAALAAK